MLGVLNLTIGVATPSSEQRAASATQGDVDNEMCPRRSRPALRRGRRPLDNAKH
jgi:hypothetical protein